MGNTGHKQVGTIWVNQPRLPGRSDSIPSRLRPARLIPTLIPSFAQNTNYQWSNYNAGFIKVEKQSSQRPRPTPLPTRWSKTDRQWRSRPEHVRSAAGARIGGQRCAAQLHRQLRLRTARSAKESAVAIDNPVLNAVVGGWQVNGIMNFRSGMPYTIWSRQTISPTSAPATSAANATGVEPQKLDPRTNDLLGSIVAAYATPARGAFGNLARNTQPGFGINNWDFSAVKNFALRMARRGIAISAPVRVVQLLQPHAVLRIPRRRSTFRRPSASSPRRSIREFCRSRLNFTGEANSLERRDLLRAVLALQPALFRPWPPQSPPAGKPRPAALRRIESFNTRVPSAEGGTAYPVTRVHTDAGITGTSFIGCPRGAA